MAPPGASGEIKVIGRWEFGRHVRLCKRRGSRKERTRQPDRGLAAGEQRGGDYRMGHQTTRTSLPGRPVMQMPAPATLYRRLMVMSTEVSASAATELTIGPA